MSAHGVHSGERIKVTATAAHSAGDLVYEGGFYGTVQDDVASGDLFTLILNKVWNFKNVPSTLPMGRIVAAPATVMATTLQVLSWTTHPSLNSHATAGWSPIGRTIETGTATTAKIQLFNPNPAAF